jgi:hypothetical protein
VLWVDENVHAAECRRFDASVVYGPTGDDCDIWIKAIGGDGYGRERAKLFTHHGFPINLGC